MYPHKTIAVDLPQFPVKKTMKRIKDRNSPLAPTGR